MQSLPTEAKPLSACSQCGTALPPPGGTATFVYGVGAVGYQTCETCGARWRYLWQDPPGVGGGLNRLPFLLVGGVIVVLLAVGVFGLVRSPTKYKAEAATPSTSTSTPRSTTTAGPPIPASVGSEFKAIVDPVVTERASLMPFLQSTALSTPQYQVDERVAPFRQLAAQANKRLAESDWPAPAAADVDTLVTLNRQFIADLDLISYDLLYSPSFRQKLADDVVSIKAAENAVRRDLGLPPSA